MQITVRLFAAYREAVGAATVPLSVPAGTTAAAVWPVLVQLYPQLGGVIVPSTFAVNDDVAAGVRVLEDGDNVALLAPVSGGA
jgi:molybdopterin converting factor small subunit